MKTWKMKNDLSFEVIETNLEQDLKPYDVQVRLTKVGITSKDVAMFKGIDPCSTSVLSSLAVGVASKVGEEVTSCREGDRVVLSPFKPCGKCLKCKTGKERDCDYFKLRGVDFDGFLKEFTILHEDEVFVLPPKVEDESALFTKYVDTALKIADSLDTSKGEFVIVGDCGIQGIILGQILKFYQAIPIFVDYNFRRITKCKEMFDYVYSMDSDSVLSEVSRITGGALADSLVLISDIAFKGEFAPDFVKYGGKIGVANPDINSDTMKVSKIYQKNLSVIPAKAMGKDFLSAINFLSNGDVSTVGLVKTSVGQGEIPSLFKTLQDDFDEKKSNLVSIVNMV